MTIEILAKHAKALSDPTRVKILRFLASCPGEFAVDDQGNVSPVNGPTVGEVCCHITGIDRATSTISFHLKELRESGLISMEKRGRQMVCQANLPVIRDLGNHLIALATPCCTPANQAPQEHE